MYQLYQNKNDAIIKIQKLSKVFQDKESRITDEIMIFNDVYSFCKDRKKLKQKAEEIKQEWVNEAKALLEKYENIKI
ncbi:MAG: hypothetical protein A2Y34_07120 [Spirochaetes bacterium GWC1_27_15]|nr:MAG: hypothetical protein A2Y34_07120 [Spirochaetes bacterium GWC1_27_15]